MSNESTNQPKIYEPPASLVAGARVSGMAAYRALVEESERDYEGYWCEEHNIISVSDSSQLAAQPVSLPAATGT